MKSIAGKKLCQICNFLQVVIIFIIKMIAFVSIPVHRNQDLKIGTLRSLMKIANLTEQDL